MADATRWTIRHRSGNEWHLTNVSGQDFTDVYCFAPEGTAAVNGEHDSVPNGATVAVHVTEVDLEPLPTEILVTSREVPDVESVPLR